ncbi:hypothetical protein M378DRAFT_199872 [Amanita muscaria Koide BX008]|uniref:Uncharacterized protein n=1 Tax=Amanita muscaria (strain Koide BX008) TaxID=946122 RepID=A0A0C2SBK1_AMAMK|nr:hypothetical protein M378DRAFT_199872 [Amanita muscaria Koide BX008]
MSSATTTTTVNTSPFFPEPTLFHPPSDPEQASRDLAKDVVVYIIASITGGIILFILLKRYLHLKRTKQPLSHFFPWPWRRSNTTSSPPTRDQSRPYPRMQSRSTDSSPYTLPYASPPPDIHDPGYTDSFDDDPRYPITAVSLHSLYCSLYPSFPSAPYHYMTNQHTTRTRAVNTDEQGRRLDSRWDPDQLGSNSFDTGTGKEALPAYDRFGGPPNYADVEREMDIASRAMADDRAEEGESRD